MVQVRLEVRTGSARFRVSVRAQSTQRAMRLAGAWYPGAREVRVLRPAMPAKIGSVGALREVAA